MKESTWTVAPDPFTFATSARKLKNRNEIKVHLASGIVGRVKEIFPQNS
jgi:hypothetical protein